jgi:hypothetical protein
MSDTETQQPLHVDESNLNVQLCTIKQMISAGFITVNSLSTGYTVEVKFPSLQQAHELHRALCALPDV